MALRSEDLKGQREALTEDVDDSDVEKAMTSDPSDSKTSDAKAQKTLRDSAMPVIMISALLLTFGALAGVVIYVVGRAFNPEDAPAALVAANSTR